MGSGAGGAVTLALEEIQAHVVTVGSFDERGWPIHWRVRALPGAAGLSVDVETGDMRLGGFTVEELRMVYDAAH